MIWLIIYVVSWFPMFFVVKKLVHDWLEKATPYLWHLKGGKLTVSDWFFVGYITVLWPAALPVFIVITHRDRKQWK